MNNYFENLNEANNLPELDEDYTSFMQSYAPTTAANSMNGYSNYMNRKNTTRGY